MSAALITGGASGIGRAIAAGLSGAGRRVVIVDSDAGQLEDTKRQLPEAHCLRLDITDADRVAALPDQLPEAFAEIDTLVNAAGHDPGGTTRFDVGTVQDWVSALQTNLVGTVQVTHAFLQQMISRGRGDVVLIGSVAGIRVVPDMVAYNTSKAGVHAFADNLRADLRDTAIRIIEVMPGLTRTDLIRKRYRGDQRRAAEYFARFGSALDPDDVARSVLHALAAPEHVVVAQLLILPNNRW